MEIYWLMVLEAGKAKTEEPVSEQGLFVGSFHSGRPKRGRETDKYRQ
jgi:hypothetical protein